MCTVRSEIKGTEKHHESCRNYRIYSTVYVLRRPLNMYIHLYVHICTYTHIHKYIYTHTYSDVCVHILTHI
jgi:hypothetical protein